MYMGESHNVLETFSFNFVVLAVLI